MAQAVQDDPRGPLLKSGVPAREAAAKGAAARERNWLARVSATRAELASHASRAVEAVGEALEAERPGWITKDGVEVAGGPDHSIRLRASTILFDRIGVGPIAHHDVHVSGSWLDQMLAPEASEHAGAVDVRAIADAGFDDAEG